MPSKIYTFEYLQKFCKENGVTLAKDYSEDCLNSDFKVEGKCTNEGCALNFKKCFKNLIKNGSLCDICNYRRSNQKKGNMCFDIELLNKTIDPALLIGEYNNISLNRESIITFKCSSVNCDCNDVKKNFRQLTISGPFCDICTEQNRKQKVEETNIINFGVPNVFQSEQIIQQIKATNLSIYGDTCALRNPLIKEKQQNTNIEKYGDICPLRNPLIKEKQQNTNIERYGGKSSMCSDIVKEKVKQTNIEKRGVECSFQAEDVKNKIKETNLSRYGDTHALRNPLIKEKQKNTILENYGVEHTFQSEEVKDKIKETNLSRHGDTCALRNPLIQEKKQNTTIERYGGKSPMCSDIVKEKAKQTSLINYGVEYPMQNAEYSEMVSKNSYKSKIYIFPSGNSIKTQGYENYALTELLQKENVLEEYIITSRTQVPVIWYLNINNKKSRYYVDIYIPSQQRCIEVKNPYHMKRNYETIKAKQKAVKDAGYKCEIWVYNGKGEKENCYI